MFPLTIEEANWIVKGSDSPPQYSSSICIDDYDNGSDEELATDQETQDEVLDELHLQEEERKENKPMDFEEFLAKSLIEPQEKEKKLSLWELMEKFHIPGERDMILSLTEN